MDRRIRDIKVESFEIVLTMRHPRPTNSHVNDYHIYISRLTQSRVPIKALNNIYKRK